MNLRPFFLTLGLSENASMAEVRSAYKKLVFQFHPDRNLDNPEVEEKFLEIVEAYEILRSHAPLSTDREIPKKYKRKTPQKRKSRGQTSQKKPKEAAKKNLKYNVYVEIENIVTGTSKVIRYIRLKDGTPENIQLKVDIPIGAKPGQRLKVKGYGNIEGQKIGDLFVIVQHLPHPLFDVREYNLEVDIPVTYLQMLLGGPVSVPTLEGIQTLVLNQCEFTNVYRILENRGLPFGESGKRGQLVARFFLDQPGVLSEMEEKTISNWKNDWPKSLRMRRFEELLPKEPKK